VVRSNRVKLVHAALVGCLCLVAPALRADDSPNADLPTLDSVLEHLDRVAGLYRDQALRFTCDETITYTTDDAIKTHEFTYIYLYSDDNRLMDSREPRGPAPDASPRKRERLENYGLPMYVLRAYSWLFLFERAKQPFHRYEVLGPGEALDRPAIRVRFEAVPPYQGGVNEWCGTTWVDRDTWQPLRVEAMAVEQCGSTEQLKQQIAGSTAPSKATLTWIMTEFDVVENGMRFPGRVVAKRSTYRVEMVGDMPSMRERPVFEITQRYENYKFFGVRTEEEISKTIKGEAKN
jgi:hypothetical protein